MELKYVSEDHAAWYRESLEYPDLFCGELARARLRWSREFDRVQDCDLTQGRLQWFIGGQLNVSGEQFHKVVGSARDTRTHARTLEKFLLHRAHMLADRANLPHTPFKATSQVNPQPQLAPLVPLPPSLPFMQVVPGLPKTRSGKIMRWILRKIAEDQPDQLGDISTLADPAVVQLISEAHTKQQPAQ